jgi:ATP-dependent DNA helicase RecQ
MLGALRLTPGRAATARAPNSAYRLAALWDAFSVPPEVQDGVQRLGHKPLLLVDDLADSRWTITVAARALRQAGASAVLPFVLAIDG